MGMTCFLLLILGLAITAQGQSCSKPVGGPNMSLKDEFILLDTFDDRSKVSFACDIGYVPIGFSQVTCTAGIWSPVRLQCHRRTCGSPGEMEHGQIDFSEGVEFGDKIVITCDEGYRFVGRPGPREIYCGVEGWEDRLPVCEAVSCEAPNTSPGVTLSPNKEMFSYGEVVRYTCPKGFTLIASESCSRDGTFKPNPPKCIRIQCEDVEIPNGEKVGISKPTYGHEDTMTFQCKSGYKMRGESTVTCDMNSQWSPKLPECEIVTCKQPKTVSNGKFSPVQDSYNYKDVVEYSCDQNYELQGAKSVSCSPDGIFTPDPPKCSAAASGPL